MQYIWLIPLLPGIGAAINGLVGIRYFSRKTAGVLACATMTMALGVALVAFWQLLQLPADARAFDIALGPIRESGQHAETNNGAVFLLVHWILFNFHGAIMAESVPQFHSNPSPIL